MSFQITKNIKSRRLDLISAITILLMLKAGKTLRCGNRYTKIYIYVNFMYTRIFREFINL